MCASVFWRHAHTGKSDITTFSVAWPPLKWSTVRGFILTQVDKFAPRKYLSSLKLVFASDTRLHTLYFSFTQHKTFVIRLWIRVESVYLIMIWTRQNRTVINGTILLKSIWLWVALGDLKTKSYRGRVRRPNRMIFWKSAKGGGGHFQSKNLCCIFWEL